MRGVWVALALVALALLHAWIDRDSGIRTWLQLRQDVGRASSQVRVLRAEITALENEAEALGEDAFALECAIREELDLVRPGEILVRMPRPRSGVPLP